MALEELGPTFVELGRMLSVRGDVLPPDVTAALGQAMPSIPPIPFVEVRALLEKELKNTLERLFITFETEPARVGVFTQAHRAVLPGEHTVLVVVVRPGVRRDLLAMRPVADVVRRRTSRRDGEELPLDPVMAVGEFAAYAAHRMDMYLALQSVRRLQGLEGLSLRVPNVYRSYSTMRCATFEAPTDMAPLKAESYHKVARALMRLGILEGIFFADLLPGRFAWGDEEIWVVDPTELTALDPERLRGIAEILVAVRRGDVDSVVRALPLVGCTVPRNTRVLQRELRDTLGSLGGPLWGEHSLAEIRSRSLEVARRGDAVLPIEISRLLDSLVVAEELGKIGDPANLNPKKVELATVAAAEAAEELISRFRDPRYVATRTLKRVVQSSDAYAEYPRQFHALLNELKDGEIEVVFRHRGIEDLISKVDILANRLVFAFLIAALIIGSSLLGIFGESDIRFVGMNVFGLIGFVIAALLGISLLIGIVRSGRL
jgi:ubiquinone biosynthesis protein